MEQLTQLKALVKALEAGNYNAAPNSLTQGAALQQEDLSNVMENVTWEKDILKLQKMIKSSPCKSTLAQFDRQLSYGSFGASATLEGGIGQEETSDYVRVVVPMAYYAHIRRVSDVANMVATFDGVKAEDRAASDAAMKLGGDIEFESFRGKADFTNGGVFDGNALALPSQMPGMLGLDVQIRMSDSQRQAQDLMFAEYGSNDTVVIAGGGTLTQEMVEDASVRSALNMGNADKLVVDPKVLSAYNKITLAKERVILAGSPQDATGADLRRQWVSGGTVSVEGSHFLRAKVQNAPLRTKGPSAPASVSPTAGSGSTGAAAGAYWYGASAVNENGESAITWASGTTTLTSGQQTSIVIAPGSGTTRYFNLYRGKAGAAQAASKFIGRVVSAASGNTTVLDLFNKLPGFVTGFLIQGDTMEMKELAPYSRKELARTDLTAPVAYFRFATLCVKQPRKNVLVDNLTGTF
jgi:hypothetical protein